MEHIRGSGIRRVIGHLQDNFDPPTGGDTHGVLETLFIGGNIGSTAIPLHDLEMRTVDMEIVGHAIGFIVADFPNFHVI